jgi:hypothetical protein
VELSEGSTNHTISNHTTNHPISNIQEIIYKIYITNSCPPHLIVKKAAADALLAKNVYEKANLLVKNVAKAHANVPIANVTAKTKV